MHCNTLLQIGDRHLGNCLLRKSDCELIPIDFGHTFGSATFLLAVPELIPFRHSKQMIELMSPHPNRNAALEAYMLTIMKAMISEKSLLLSSMKAYLVDPILEWRQKSSNSLIQKFESLKIKSQNQTCLNIVKKKLACESPFNILIDTLQTNKNPDFKEFKQVALNFVASLQNDYKNITCNNSVCDDNDEDRAIKDQIRQLMMLATDERVHYRSWHGLNLWC